jgi:hypothetical protein
VLAQAVPVFDWTSGLLVVRVHTNSMAGTNQLLVEVRNVSLAPDDPTLVFGTGAIASPPSAIATATIATATTAGALFGPSLGSTLGPMPTFGGGLVRSIQIEHNGALAGCGALILHQMPYGALVPNPEDTLSFGFAFNRDVDPPNIVADILDLARQIELSSAWHPGDLFADL